MQEPEGFSGKDIIVAAVPAIVMMGAAYLIGYLGNVGISYFTFLDIQDFLNTTAAFLPAAIVFYAFFFFSFAFSHHKEGSNYLNEIQTGEKEPAREAESLVRDFNSLLFDSTTGKWRENRILELKVGTLLSFLVFFCSLVAILLGARVSLFVLWPSVAAFSLLAQALLAYFTTRYDDDVKPLYALGATMALYIFCYGVTASRMDESRRDVRYVVFLEQGEVLSTSVVRRVGGNILIHDIDSWSWKLIPTDRISSVSQDPAKPDRGLLSGGLRQNPDRTQTPAG